MSRFRMLVVILGAWLFVGTLTLSGCSPRLTEKDLGEVQTDRRQLPGAGEPYPLPEMNSDAKQAQEQRSEEQGTGEEKADKD